MPKGARGGVYIASAVLGVQTGDNKTTTKHCRVSSHARARLAQRSPYLVTMTEIISSLGTTSHRKRLLQGLLDYRALPLAGCRSTTPQSEVVALPHWMPAQGRETYQRAACFRRWSSAFETSPALTRAFTQVLVRRLPARSMHSRNASVSIPYSPQCAL